MNLLARFWQSLTGRCCTADMELTMPDGGTQELSISAGSLDELGEKIFLAGMAFGREHPWLAPYPPEEGGKS